MRQFKDPIYGYIHIPKNLSSQIIDTCEFQRLRNIRQTSYSALYPSSLHNRFIHSIGVYHLGVLASKSILRSDCLCNEEVSEDGLLEEAKTLADVFRLACLLHDVGHSPFSHSGEELYFNPNAEKVFSLLIEKVDDESFTADAKQRHLTGKNAAPHEIVSVIVALNQYEAYIPPAYVDFFARCITGYTYNNDSDDKTYQLRNCFIRLLNSTLIDVDRLDYIIRDSFTAGFQSVSIDYERLLSGWRIIPHHDRLELAFNKGALTIIEHVIYAHDAERKWVQNHPAILYDSYLVEYAIEQVSKFYTTDDKRLFSVDALSLEGVHFGDRGRIRLLSDEDIIFTAKNQLIDDPLISEYFSREKRRHPVWKSEAEYRALFEENLAREKLAELATVVKDITSYMQKNNIPAIDDNLMRCCSSEIEQAQDLPENERTDIVAAREKIRKWAAVFAEYAKDQHIPNDFVIIMKSQFKSNFAKEDIGALLINFPNFEKTLQLKDVITMLSADVPNENFFYVFSHRPESGEPVDAHKLASLLSRELFAVT